MRKVIVLIVVSLAAGNLATAGMPYFHEGSASQPQAKPSGWNWPTWLTGKPAPPDPQLMYQPPTQPPTTTQRITTALTDNPAVNTARGWMTPSSNAGTTAKVDPLSLSQPTGKPTPALLVSIAQVREQQGDVDAARQLYGQALAAGPQDLKTLREFGHFEDRQNCLIDAERYYAEAARLAPQNAAVLNDLALCLARQGKPGPSAEVLAQAIRLDPQKTLYRNNMATVLMELGDQHEAMQHLLAAHPPAAAYFNMGHLLEKGQQLPAAAAHYAEAARLDPAMDAARVALARVAPPQAPRVQQTAMAPAAAQPSVSVENSWPSEDISMGKTSSAPPTSVREPEFGPRLLPPVQ